MENKKKSNIFSKIIIVFIFIFIILYIINDLGYVNNINYNQTLSTEEEILEFEDDVNNGKNIKDKYLNISDKDYTNYFSDFGETISLTIENGFEYLINYFKKICTYLFA